MKQLCVILQGASGSGKSTLVLDTLLKSVETKLLRRSASVFGAQDIEGIDQLDKIINVDQSPIGRTPRSNRIERRSLNRREPAVSFFSSRRNRARMGGVGQAREERASGISAMASMAKG
jgi:energy-coupling factor transporter ATP-binding protein EcfA2